MYQIYIMQLVKTENGMFRGQWVPVAQRQTLALCESFERSYWASAYRFVKM